MISITPKDKSIEVIFEPLGSGTLLEKSTQEVRRAHHRELIDRKNR